MTQKLEEKITEGEKKKGFVIDSKTVFNLAGKLIGGYILYELGKFAGGDYGAIVGAYIGLRATYRAK